MEIQPSDQSVTYRQSVSNHLRHGSRDIINPARISCEASLMPLNSRRNDDLHHAYLAELTSVYFEVVVLAFQLASNG